MLKYMESTDNKQFTELSDEELEKVNGGSFHVGPAISCDPIKCPELGKETDPKTCECI